MTSRLAELQKYCRDVSSSEDAYDSNGGDSDAGSSDVEMGGGNQTEKWVDEWQEEADNEVEAFLGEVEEIKSMMDEVHESLENLQSLYSKFLSTTNEEKERAISSEIDEMLDDTNDLAQTIREELKRMKEDIDEFEATSIKRGRNHTAVIAIKNNMHTKLVKNFLALMQDYQEMQTDYQGKYKKRFTDQVHLVDPNVTEDQIDEMLEEGRSPQVFADEILQAKKKDDAKLALTFIMEQHEDILKIERSITELQQLFVDMMVMIEMQGELLDQVENSVVSAKEYTGKATATLRATEEIANKNRMKWIVIIVLIIVIIIIIIVIVIIIIIAIFVFLVLTGVISGITIPLTTGSS